MKIQLNKEDLSIVAPIYKVVYLLLGLAPLLYTCVRDVRVLLKRTLYEPLYEVVAKCLGDLAEEFV